jgi:hypothetical protein
VVIGLYGSEARQADSADQTGLQAIEKLLAQTSGTEAREYLLPHAGSKKIVNKAASWAYGLGAVAGAYSTGLSLRQMYINIHEGDDATVLHAGMASGFFSLTLAAGAGYVASSEAFIGTMIGKLALRIIGGPWLWLGLGLVLLGNMLLVKVFKENDPIDWWLKYGPFSKLADPNKLVLPQIDGSKLLGGPRGSAIKLDRNDNIIQVIPAPQGIFHKASDGEVVALEDGNARPIRRIGGPVDARFLINYGDTYHDSRFNGHEPGTQPEDQCGRWYEHPEMAYMALFEVIFVPPSEVISPPENSACTLRRFRAGKSKTV